MATQYEDFMAFSSSSRAGVPQLTRGLCAVGSRAYTGEVEVLRDWLGAACDG